MTTSCCRFQKELVLKYWSILHEGNTQPSAIAHHVGSSNSSHHRWFFLENLAAHPKPTGEQSLISFGSFGRRITFSQIRKHSWFQKAELRWDFNFAFGSYIVILDFLVESESGDFWMSWLANISVINIVYELGVALPPSKLWANEGYYRDLYLLPCDNPGGHCYSQGSTPNLWWVSYHFRWLEAFRICPSTLRRRWTWRLKSLSGA